MSKDVTKLNMPSKDELLGYLTSKNIGLNDEMAQHVLNICIQEGNVEGNLLFHSNEFLTDSAKKMYL